MGREFASAAARWCNLDIDIPTPVISAVCDHSSERRQWFTDNFPAIGLSTGDYRELLASDEVDAIYCAVPHNLHEEIYIDIIKAGKHLLGEKPFGIDLAANQAILAAVAERSDLVIRCSSEFPYFPAAQRLIKWLREKRYGRIMEVRAGFHHSSDMDLTKAINWKRMIAVNGEYGCMGDLGMHVLHIPLRMGWRPRSVYAALQNIAATRPGPDGEPVPCETWDNATLLCECLDPDNGEPFTMQLDTKRMAPGATNTWFIEVYGTDGSAKFSTHEPKAFMTLESVGKEQAWSRVDVGVASAFPVITGGIFEFGFADCLQQMLAAFMNEFAGEPHGAFGCVTPDETAWSHLIFTAALESDESGRRVSIT